MFTKMSVATLAAVCVFSLSGCGGGGQSAITTTGGTGGSGGGGTQLPAAKSLGKTRLDVDLGAGTVKVIPLVEPTDLNGRAVFSGSALTVNSATVATVADNGFNQQLLSIDIAVNSPYYTPSLGPLLVSFQPTTGTGLRTEALAGSGASGSTDGAAALGATGTPYCAWTDTDGSVYFSQGDSGAIRKLKSGTLSTLTSGFNTPTGIVGDANYIYFCEQSVHRIVKINKTGTTGSILAGSGTAGSADGTGSGASFNLPTGLAISGGTLFVADYGNSSVRTVSTASGATTTFATGITGAIGVTTGTIGGQSVVAATSNSGGYVRIIGTGGGTVTLGDAAGTTGAAILPNDTVVLCNNVSNQFRVLQMTAGANPFSTGSWYTVGVVGGLGNTDGQLPTFSGPFLIGYTQGTGLVVADTNNKRLRTLAIDSSAASGSNPVTFEGADGFWPNSVPFYSTLPGKLKVGFSSPTSQRFSLLMVVDGPTAVPIRPGPSQGVNPSQVLSFIAGGDTSNTLAVDGVGGVARFANLGSLSVSKSGLIAGTDYNSIVLADATGRIKRLTGQLDITQTDGFGYAMSAGNPAHSVAINDAATVILFSTDSAVFRLSRSLTSDPWDPASWYGSLIAGSSTATGNVDGLGTSARFSFPRVAFASSTDGSHFFVSDSGNSTIRDVFARSGDPSVASSYSVITLAGSTNGFADGVGFSAKFNNPPYIAVGADGYIYVGDQFNHRIRKVSTNGTVTTVAGNGTAVLQDGSPGELFYTLFLAADTSGNIWFVDYNGNFILRKVSGTTLSTYTTIPNVTGLTVAPKDGSFYFSSTRTLGHLSRIID